MIWFWFQCLSKGLNKNKLEIKIMITIIQLVKKYMFNQSLNITLSKILYFICP